MGIYARIFYAIYAWQHRLYGEIDGPQYSAALGLSLVALINITCVAHLIGAPIRDLPAAVWGFTGLLLAVLHWLVFVRGGRFRRLPKEFHFEKPEKLGAADLLAMGYMLGSVALLVAAWAAESPAA